jgi:hypothetical protein
MVVLGLWLLVFDVLLNLNLKTQVGVAVKDLRPKTQVHPLLTNILASEQNPARLFFNTLV